MKNFDNGIKNIIKKFAYDFYIIQQDFNVMCSCVDYTTKQADPLCPKCLSTGRKVRIRKIKGASQHESGSFRNMGLDEQTTASVYFIDGKYPVYEKNYIVDHDEVYIIHRLEIKKTTDRKPVYYKVMAHHKKSHINAFLKNFKRIVKGD